MVSHLALELRLRLALELELISSASLGALAKISPLRRLGA